MPEFRWRTSRRNLQLWHLGGLGCAVCLDVRSALHLVYTSRWLTRMTLMQHRVPKPGSPWQITKARYEHKTAFILHNINSLNVFEVDLTWVYWTVKNHSTLRCRCLGCYEQCSLLVQSGGCVQWLLSSSWRGGFGRGLRLSRNLHCLRAFQPCGIFFAAFSIIGAFEASTREGLCPVPKSNHHLRWQCEFALPISILWFLNFSGFLFATAPFLDVVINGMLARSILIQGLLRRYPNYFCTFSNVIFVQQGPR